jgi:nucleotide-binding universal stress UspA family protein
MLKHILVPLDGSRFGSRALKYAQEIAKPFEAEVILLQVVKPTAPMTGATAEPGMQSPASTRIAVQIALDEDKRNVSQAKR